jgi:hypothetical protein
MGIEEQKEEREVLEAIFPEEIAGWLFSIKYYCTCLTYPLQMFPRLNSEFR